ncbi:I78 family peptidase inhibitor [Marinovum sp.]|uniref:I78 family peptidase inhibitor n=1 Tax=Marinovum sp. TaxID=2024839 RepID=UPI003A8FD243
MQDVLCRAGGLSVVLLGLAGCLPEGQGLMKAPPRASEAPHCAPGVYAGIVGEPVAAADEVPSPKRILGPGQARTMDYIPARTNIEVDAKGKITRVFCG